MCRHLTNYGRNVTKALEERSEYHFGEGMRVSKENQDLEVGPAV